jgi:hypothetical protein
MNWWQFTWTMLLWSLKVRSINKFGGMGGVKTEDGQYAGVEAMSDVCEKFQVDVCALQELKTTSYQGKGTSVGGRVLHPPTPQLYFLPLPSVCGKGGLDCGDSGGRVHRHPRADTRKLYVFLFSLLKGYYFYRFVALPPTNQPTILCVLR